MDPDKMTMQERLDPPPTAATGHSRPRPTAERAARPAHRLLAFLLVVFAAAIATPAASAEIVVSRDNEGRQMTFDVRATDADVEWYAGLFRSAVHGNEISSVTIRIVPDDQIPRYCGAGAAACYGSRGGGGTIVVPSGRSDAVASIVLHEYGHHLDGNWPVAGVREPNGTPGWWNARGIAELLRNGLVAFDYSRGWSRSIAEIFAEDYAYAHLPIRYAIPWLSPPDDAFRTALRNELRAGTPTAEPEPAPMPQPLVINRSGTLAPRSARNLPFGLLGPGRHVTFTATVARATQRGVRARMDIVCDGVRVATGQFGKGRRTRTLDLPSLGPAQCQARLVSTSRTAVAYSLRLRLAIESGTA